MSVKKKILISQLLSVALFVLVSAIVHVRFGEMEPQLNSIHTHFRTVSEDELRLVMAAKEAKYNVTQVQQWLTDISATRGLDGLNDGFDEAEKAATRLTNNLNEIKELATKMQRPEILAITAQLEASFPDYYDTGRKMAKAYVEFGPEGGNRMMGAFDATASTMNDGTDQLVDLVEQRVRVDAKSTSEEIDFMKREIGSSSVIVMCLSIAALVMVMLTATYLYRMMARNFRLLTTDITQIERGQYDIAAQMNVSAQDEFGYVARALDAVRGKLREGKQLEAQQQQMEQRAKEEHIRSRNELANRFQQRVQGIIESVAAAATQLYQTSESMSGIIGDVGMKASSVARSSSEASHNVQTVASATEEMTASVREIAEQISKSVGSVRIAVGEVEKADQTALMLEQATTRIGEVVGLIQTIAGQINLLSLNATIESARAGEAGKGFAVVASEVKSLAGQTATATNEISDTIAGIQDVSRQVLAALDAIKRAIGQVDEFSSAISAAVEEQTATTNEISSNMAYAANGTTQINNDIGMVNQATGEAKLSANQVLDAAKMLSKEAESLSVEVDLFLSEVRAG